MPDEPISTTVPETVTVDTGADPESIGKLEDSFKDFWKEADAAEPSSAPDAPGPGQETKEPRKPVKVIEPELKVDEPPATKAVEPPEDDIDKLELSNPNAKPEVQQDFKHIKDMWKNDRARYKAEQERAKALALELEETKKNAWTPETKADYEHAASIRRKFDFVSDPDFIEKFHKPLRNHYENILDEAVAALPDKNAATQWAQFIKTNYTPDQLNREWWLNSVIAKIPNEMDRASVLQRRTNDKSSFDNWINEKTETTAKRVQEEIMAEIGIQEKRIQEVLPRDVESAKTAAERKAIEEHNARFQKLNKFFVDTMQDLSKHGPKAWVRASVEATRAQLLDGAYKEVESELKSVKAERDQLQQELDKISGARRRISHTSGTPPASSNNGKKTSDGLSIKNLDIRESFKNFDWGDNS
jgi:hypothetical protein